MAVADRTVLTDAVVVAPDRVVDRGSVVVEAGLIAAVLPRSLPAGPETIGLGGRVLLPGLVDLHDDAIEIDLNPRPGAEFAPMFGLLQLDRKLAAAGVTTQFHAVYFPDDFARRSIAQARSVGAAIGEFQRRGLGTIDHHAMLRLDVRAPGALSAVTEALDRLAIPLVALSDHVPGRGQFRDIAAYRRFLSRDLGDAAGEATIDAAIAADLRRAAATEQVVTETLARLARLRGERELILVSHDDDTPERVELMHDLGCRIAEFPLTVEAAARAKALGMTVAMGAANALRGGSLSGNVGARDLLARGLVDVLVADYSAPALLAALFRIVALGLATLPAATRLVTANPAAAVGLHDRGAIEPGRRADLVAVEQVSAIPLAAATMVGGRWAYLVGGLAASVRPAGAA